MSYKTKPTSKICCERYQKHLSTFSTTYTAKRSHSKTCSNTVKTEPQHSTKNKSCSTGTLINNISKLAKPKKTTKSEFIFHGKAQFTKNGPLVKTCGDTAQKLHVKTPNKFFIEPNDTNTYEPVEQYYKNENYQQSTASMQGADCLRKISSLNTINEQSEENYDRRSESDIQSDDSDTDIEIIESDIEELKQFRHENYFECHSTSSKLKNIPSVTSLNNHKCAYRFYLNERLFPVPVSTDYNKLIRCTECQLPLELNSNFENLNGTIQAKVKLNGQVQDMMLMLPVKKSLIIKERRKELEERKEDNNLYFGIVKLSIDGDSIFNRNLPSNSLALRYQKGYREYAVNEKYQYESVNNNDVIII